MTTTTKAIEAAKPKDKAYKLADGEGLYLYVAPTGLKSWRANYLREGKQATRTYGRWPAMSLADARQAHRGSKDPIKKLGAPTFKEVATAWLVIKLPSLSNEKHKGQVQNTLERFAYPALGSRAIDSIPRKDLVAVVSNAQEGGKIETAHRVASRITAVFDYAQDAGLIEHHGAAGLTRILQPRKVKKPMASIPQEQAGELMIKVAGYPDLITRMALQLMALTFVRVGELRGMRWDEFKEDGAIWVIPEARMKAKLPHVVPLSKPAQKIIATLREMTGDGILVLDSPLRPGHPISENTMLFALYRLGYKGAMTVHGFRALASTVLNEHSGFAHDVIERQLAHQESDAVRAAYNRAEYLPKRRELMDWWAQWLEAQHSAEGQPPASA